MKIKSLVLFLGIVPLCVTSCTTVKKTASSIDVENVLRSESVADLNVNNERINYTYYPSKSVRRGGIENTKNAAVTEALRSNGNADVLVAPQYEIRIRKKLFGGKKIKSVSVTGYPAKYSNFRVK